MHARDVRTRRIAVRRYACGSNCAAVGKMFQPRHHTCIHIRRDSRHTSRHSALCRVVRESDPWIGIAATVGQCHALSPQTHTDAANLQAAWGGHVHSEAVRCFPRALVADTRINLAREAGAEHPAVRMNIGVMIGWKFMIRVSLPFPSDYSKRHSKTQALARLSRHKCAEKRASARLCRFHELPSRCLSSPP
jgi:hypothetical protein